MTNSVQESTQTGLDRILAPLTSEDFMDTWFDNKPLFIAGKYNKFSELPNVEAVQECLALGLPWQLQRLPEVYLDGEKVAASDIHFKLSNMDDLITTKPNVGRYEKLLNAGATIALYGMQHVFTELNQLVQELVEQTRAEVEAHLFLSQQGLKGLAPHYDCVDILVLQVAGSKHWQLSSQRAYNPINGKGAATIYDPQAAHSEYELNPGDVLYIPRGTFHHALALSETSLHVTIPLKFPTRVDLLSSMLEAAFNHDQMRTSLNLQSESDLKNALESTLSVLSEMTGSGAFTEEFLTNRTDRNRVAGPQFFSEVHNEDGKGA